MLDKRIGITSGAGFFRDSFSDPMLLEEMLGFIFR